MARQQADEVAFVGVAGRDDVEAFQEFVDRHDLGGIPHIADVDGSVWRRFGVTAQPSWAFIDGETGDATRQFGALGVEGLTERVEALGGPAGP